MRTFLFLLSTIFILSCNPIETEKNTTDTLQIQEEKEPEVTVPETFEALDIEATNKKLVAIKDSLNPKEIMALYYPLEPETNEGNQKIEVAEKTLDNGEIEVELIHSNLLDDSLLAEKYIMLLQNIKGKWAIISIKKSWKCRKDRGHSYWNAEKCN
jgi:hypothetical protein